MLIRKSNLHRRIGLLLFLLLVSSVGLFLWQESETRRLENGGAALHAQIANLEQTVTVQQDRNDGIVPVHPESENEVVFMNGKVTVSIRPIWEKAKSPEFSVQCTGGSRDAAVMCLGVDSLVPSELAGEQDSRFSVVVAVFENKQNRTAEDWYENEYGGYAKSQYNCNVCVPKIVNPLAEVIGGYDGYSLIIQPSLDAEPHYVYVHYVLVNKDLAVVVSSTLLNHESTNGRPRTNDYRDFADEVKALASSVRFNN